MYQIRKVETFSVLRHTETATLDPEKFRKFVFEGNTEEEFLNFISELDFDEVYDELDQESKDELIKIKEDYDWTEFYNSAWDEEKSWFDIGAENEEFRKTGGFEIRYTTEK